MMRIYSNGDGGLFGLLMGSSQANGHDNDDALQAIADAEKAFERAMGQAARTNFKDDLHMRLTLLSILESWKCVQRARTAAGY